MSPASDCGCCATVAPAVPATVENRPGLSAVAYRIGSFASFRQAIVDELSRTPELAALSTRVSEDYTITTIELWAAVADVLAFYQERIANEAFLRTATLRDSMLRLVRLIGYELGPGAAATAQLAFTLESGALATIPAASRVQSVPGEGETPQKFETLAALAADGRLNRLRLRPTPVPDTPLAAGRRSAIVAPGAAALAATFAAAPGDRVVVYGASALEIITVQALRVEDDQAWLDWTTPLAGNFASVAIDPSATGSGACAIGRTLRMFGSAAPKTWVQAKLKVASDPTSTYLDTATTSFALTADGSNGSNELFLDGRHDGLQPGTGLLLVVSSGATTATRRVLVASVRQGRAERGPVADTVTQLTVKDPSPAVVLNLSSVITGSVADVLILELRGAPLLFWPYRFPATLSAPAACLPGRRAGWNAIELERRIAKGRYGAGILLDAGALLPPRPLLLADADPARVVSATVAGSSLVGADLAIEPTATDATTAATLGFGPGAARRATALVSAPLGATLTLPNSVRELLVTIGTAPPLPVSLGTALPASTTPFAVAAALQTALRAASAAPGFARARVIATVGATLSEQALVLVPGVTEDAVLIAPSPTDGDTVLALGLDASHVRWVDGLLSGPVGPLGGGLVGALRISLGIDPPRDQTLALSPGGGLVLAASTLAAMTGGPALGIDAERLLVFPRIPTPDQRQFLRVALATTASLALDGASAVLLGNVVAASHGETVRNEVVGDTDASLAFQRFTLKKKPLTFVPSITPGGLASTLSLLVGGVRWTEVPTLYGAGPRDEVFITRRADDGTQSLQFGDGVTGARPASGRQSLVATYRHGIGLAGRVAASKLSTLLDRPTGVKGVTNPLAADGGADPQALDSAREAAPGTVRTFGRAVSLRDFEDTALMAGEVAKACATWVWTGERRAIHLTIAAQGGAAFSADALDRIAATLATERDPNHRLLIGNHSAVAVCVTASLSVDPAWVNDSVLAAARAALLNALSFEQRRFAEPVFLSDLYRVLQDVAGVVSVDIDRLDLKSSNAAFRAAHGVDDSLPQPQPRLLMLPARPGGGVGAVLPAELAWVELPTQDILLSASGGLTS